MARLKVLLQVWQSSNGLPPLPRICAFFIFSSVKSHSQILRQQVLQGKNLGKSGKSVTRVNVSMLECSNAPIKSAEREDPAVPFSSHTEDVICISKALKKENSLGKWASKPALNQGPSCLLSERTSSHIWMRIMALCRTKRPQQMG